MAIQQLTEVQKKMLNNMCISAQEVNMGTLLSNLITSANEGGTGFVPVATVEVAGKVKASSEVIVDENGVMGIGEIEQTKVKGLVEELNSINKEIEQITETGVSVEVVNRIDTVESSITVVEDDIDKVEEKLSTVEENQQWGSFPIN